MECKEIERLFDRYFDREISRLEYQALRGHLARCASCRENFLNLQFSLDFFEAIPLESPSDTWVMPELGELTIPMNRKPSRTRIYAVAACVLLAAVVTMIDGTTGTPGAAILISPAEGKKILGTSNRHWVVPKGTTLKGDLYIQGDVTIQGTVEGDVHVQRWKREENSGGEELPFSERIQRWWKGVVTP